MNIKSDFDGDFQIVNQLGQTVRTFKVISNTINSINLTSLSDGIYFVKGTDGTKMITKKIIINK
jgi:hypothetical protein